MLHWYIILPLSLLWNETNLSLKGISSRGRFQKAIFVTSRPPVFLVLLSRQHVRFSFSSGAWSICMKIILYHCILISFYCYKCMCRNFGYVVLMLVVILIISSCLFLGKKKCYTCIFSWFSIKRYLHHYACCLCFCSRCISCVYLFHLSFFFT